MAVIQVSLIQVRSGLNENLPSLATGEFGWSIIPNNYILVMVQLQKVVQILVVLLKFLRYTVVIL